MLQLPKHFPKMRFHGPTKMHYVWVNGGRVYLGRDFEEAQQKYQYLKNEWNRQQLSAKMTPANPPESLGLGLSVAELLVKYLEARTAEGADARELGRIKTASRVVRTLFGSIPANEFRVKALKDCRKALIDAPPKKRSKDNPKVRHITPQGDAQAYSRRYINHLTNTIKSIWQWGVTEELVNAETWYSLRALRSLRVGKGGRETFDVVPVEPAVVDATLPFTHATIAAMVRFQQLAGMRPGELVMLRRRDVSITTSERVPLPNTRKQLAAFEDADTGTLIWLAIPASHKTFTRGKTRVIVIGPAAQRILGPLLEGLGPDDYIFSPQRALAGRPRGKPREHYSTNSYGRAIGYAIEAANRRRAACNQEKLPHWQPNQLRHHVATEVAEEFDDSHASAVLGNGPSVIGTYVEQSLRKAAKVAAKMG